VYPARREFEESANRAVFFFSLVGFVVSIKLAFFLLGGCDKVYSIEHQQPVR
jgi:hypothetical protein